jgi:hypothetical protein
MAMTFRRILRLSEITGSMLAISALVQACSTDSRNDGGPVGHSAIEYAGNTLKVAENMPLGLVRDAVNDALKDLQMAVTADNKANNHVRLEAQDPRNQLVIVELTGINRQTTEVQIRVGSTDSAENRAEEHQIYDRMKNRF